jgi:integration host factor subunit alpha
MTLTKDRLISSIGDRVGFSKFESSRILESVLETIKTSLSKGEDVLVSGYGTFNS